MLRVDRTMGTLVRLGEASLSSAGMTERNDLQALILRNGEEFFERECNERLFLLGEEIQPSLRVADRIDLLAVDENGHSVIIELKRGDHKLQLLQALSYASMIADLEPDQFEALMSSDRRELFNAFKSENSIESSNQRQRILLIAEHYDYSILSTAKWLTDFYGMNISCYQISLARDASNNAEYISAVQVFPPKQLADQARQRGAKRSEEGSQFRTIEELLTTCSNATVTTFFEKQILVPDIRRNRRRDCIVYPQSGKMRFLVQPQPHKARVMQWGRFEGDKQLWMDRLSSASVRDRGGELRFYLSTEADFTFFASFAENDLAKQRWQKVDMEEDAFDE